MQQFQFFQLRTNERLLDKMVTRNDLSLLHTLLYVNIWSIKTPQAFFPNVTVLTVSLSHFPICRGTTTVQHATIM